MSSTLCNHCETSFGCIKGVAEYRYPVDFLGHFREVKQEECRVKCKRCEFLGADPDFFFQKPEIARHLQNIWRNESGLTLPA